MIMIRVIAACLLFFPAVLSGYPAAAQSVSPADTPAAIEVVDPRHEERVALARALNAVNPVSTITESAVTDLAGLWGIADVEAFKQAVIAKVDNAVLETASINALADVFTAAELKHMVGYYSAPEAAEITKKMQLYQQLVQPELAKALDKALVELRLGPGDAVPPVPNP